MSKRMNRTASRRRWLVGRVAASSRAGEGPMVFAVRHLMCDSPGHLGNLATARPSLGTSIQ